MTQTHSGWVVFSAVQGLHRKTKIAELVLLPSYDEIETIYDDHGPSKFNGCVTDPAVVKEYDEQIVGEAKDRFLHNVEPGTGLIREVVQLMRWYSQSSHPQNSDDAMIWLKAFMKGTAAQYARDPLKTEVEIFSMYFQDVFYNIQIVD